MNSLEQLNNYSSSLVSASDERTNPFAEFVGDLGTLGVSADEDGTQIIASQYGRFNIVEATETGTANVITVTIDLSASVGQGGQVDWGSNKPAGVTISNAGGVWTATNILTVDDYNKTIGADNNSAIITFVDQDVDFSYTINASYPGADGTINHARTYNVVIGTTSDEMSFSPTTTQQVSVNQIVVLTTPPQVTDDTASSNATYTMIVNPSTSGIVDFQITQSFATSNSGTNGISMGPFTRSGMNTNLSNINLQGLGDNTTDITFQLTNNLSSVVSNGTMTGLTSEPLSGFSSGSTTTRTYTENTINTNLFASGPPVVNSVIETTYGDGTYKVTLTAGADGRVRQDTSSTPTASLIKTDTIANLNTWLANDIQYIPNAGVFSTQTLSLKIERITTVFVIDTDTFSLTGTANASALPEEGLYQNTTLNNSDNLRFFLKTDILLVGGGATGGQAIGTVGLDGTGGGGGGAGSVLSIVDADLFKNNETLTQVELYTDTTTSNLRQNTPGPSSILGRATIGGVGGQGSGNNTGADAYAGGQGGGGAGETGTRGVGALNVINTFTSGTIVTKQEDGLNGRTKATGGSNYGGGGSGFTSSISGSSIVYAVAGPPGNDSTNTSNPAATVTPGSGGRGANYRTGTFGTNPGGAGQTGVAYIKVYQ